MFEHLLKPSTRLQRMERISDDVRDPPKYFHHIFVKLNFRKQKTMSNFLASNKSAF